MSSTDFNLTFSVNQSPESVFDAINNVRGWWSENIEGSTSKLNDVFTYRIADIQQCTLKLTEVVPGQKIVWHCLDNYFDFARNGSEWTGTRIEFAITEQNGLTDIHFTHWGLTPAYESYDISFDAWFTYINYSLRDLITTGVGKPNPKAVLAT